MSHAAKIRRSYKTYQERAFFTRRVMRALQRLGYTMREIGEAWGLNRAQVWAIMTTDKYAIHFYDGKNTTAMEDSVSEIIWAQDEIWPWSQSELDYMREKYPSQSVTFLEICNALNRSRGSVSGKARMLGLRRPAGENGPLRLKTARPSISSLSTNCAVRA